MPRTAAIDRDRFQRYVSALNLDANFSGIHGVGVIEWVPAARKAAHIADMRQGGIPDYTIHPDGPRADYAPIIQREPFVGLARSSPGFDAWDEPVRRAAMEKARDSGMAALSGKVRLSVDLDADLRPGFIMYLPIYASGKAQDNLAAASGEHYRLGLCIVPYARRDGQSLRRTATRYLAGHLRWRRAIGGGAAASHFRCKQPACARAHLRKRISGCGRARLDAHR